MSPLATGKPGIAITFRSLRGLGKTVGTPGMNARLHHIAPRAHADDARGGDHDRDGQGDQQGAKESGLHGAFRRSDSGAECLRLSTKTLISATSRSNAGFAVKMIT